MTMTWSIRFLALGFALGLAPMGPAQVEVGRTVGSGTSGLGRALAVGADWDSDRVPELLIGMPGQAGGAGRVEVRRGKDFAVLSSFDGAPGRRIGTEVLLLGDLDGDLVPEIAWLEAGTAPAVAGVVRVVSGGTGQSLRFFGAAGAANPMLPYGGRPTALARGSGSKVLVSMPLSMGGSNAIRVYDATNGAIRLTIIAPTPEHRHFAGALAPAFARPGGHTIVAGTELFPDDLQDAAPRRGEVRAIDEATGAVLWVVQGPRGHARFGASLATLPDEDGDGHAEIAVGTPSAPEAAPAVSGEVRILSGRTGALIRVLPGVGPGDRFGAALTTLGDYDGDALADLAIGAPGALPARVLIRDPRTGIQFGSAEGLTAELGFGGALAGGGDRTAGLCDLLVGAPDGSPQVRLLQWPLRPGSGRDLTLHSGVRANPSRRDLFQVYGGEPMSWQFASPGSSLVGSAAALFLELVPAGAMRGPQFGLPDAWVDPTGQSGPFVTVFQGPLPGSGIEIPLNAASGLTGLSALVQGLVISPSLPQGYATTNAHEFVHLPIPTIYVAPTGRTGASGFDPSDPLVSVQAAIDLAELSFDPERFVPYPEIRIATGTYLESIAVDVPLTIRGGCDLSTWTQVMGQVSVLRSDHRGARFRSITAPALVSAIEFAAENGRFSTSLSMELASVALDVRGSTSALRFEDCGFIAGRGAPGPNGLPGANVGSDGDPGARGGNGFYTLEANRFGSGGGGGDGAIDGGRGGNGGRTRCTNSFLGACLTATADSGNSGSSAQGCNNGASAGGRATCGRAGNGNDGGPGAPGASGSLGQPSMALQGIINQGNWVGSWAGSGGFGSIGCGGGGGGGGGAVECAQQFAVGAGGGGGGGGGRGGEGGTGGGQGGASFAVWLFDASPTFARCRFVAGQGGAGGTGGDGLAGSLGGQGGNGGNGWGGTVAGAGIQSGDGGDGGDGGNGGGGGGGGGGHGGPSFCVFRAGTSSPPGLTGAGNTFTPGQGGPAGLGGQVGGSATRAPSGQAGPAGILGS